MSRALAGSPCIWRKTRQKVEAAAQARPVRTTFDVDTPGSARNRAAMLLAGLVTHRFIPRATDGLAPDRRQDRVIDISAGTRCTGRSP